MSLAVKIYEAFKDDEHKARALLEVVEELEGRITSDLATKGDVELAKLALKKEIEEVKLSLQKEIEEVRLSLQKEIEKTKAGIIKWVTGLLVIQTGLIVSIITLLR